MFTTVVRCLVLIIIAAALTACGQSDTTKTPDSQVVARIGPDVVTVLELENEMRAVHVQPEARKEPETIRKLVGDLVTRKALARRALTQKLDREPTVLLDLLRSKDIVLAEAVSARAVEAKLAAIGPAEIQRYMQDNPIKFANRQLLQVEQFVVSWANINQSLLQASRSVKTAEEMAQLLSNAQISFSKSFGVLNTADLPDDLSNTIRSQGLDGIMFVRVGQNGAFLKVVSRETRPFTGPAAEVAARQMIRADLIKGENSVASFAAGLEATYVGEYAKIMEKKSAR